MPFFRPKVILFDLDDTLMDHDGSLKAGIKSIFESHSILQAFYQNLSHFEADWRKVHEKYFLEYVQGRMSHDEQRKLRIKSLWANASVSLSDAECIAVSDSFLRVYQQNWHSKGLS